MRWTVTVLKAIFFLVLSQGIKSGMNIWGQRLTRVQRMPPGLGRSPGREMATHSSVLAGKSHGQRSWQATVHGVSKIQTWLSTNTECPSFLKTSHLCVCIYIYRHNLYMCRANSVLLIVSNIYIHFPSIWFGQIPSGCSGFSLGFLFYLLSRLDFSISTFL